jgi:hypothetical protein
VKLRTGDAYMPTSVDRTRRTAVDTRLHWEVVCLWVAGGLVIFALLSDIGLSGQVAQAMAWG